MSVDKERIKELLGSGLSNQVVADAVGVDNSYISQLLSNDDFANEVVSLRTKNLTAANDRDRKIDGIEDNLITQLDEMVAERRFYKPQDLLRSFAVINAARRRGVPAQAALGTQNSIVNLTMPTIVIQQFTKSAQGEVIEVVTEQKRQTLVTMPTGELLKRLAKDEADGSKYEKVQRFLPAQTS